MNTRICDLDNELYSLVEFQGILQDSKRYSSVISCNSCGERLAIERAFCHGVVSEKLRQGDEHRVRKEFKKTRELNGN